MLELYREENILRERGNWLVKLLSFHRQCLYTVESV